MRWLLLVLGLAVVVAVAFGAGSLGDRIGGDDPSATLPVERAVRATLSESTVTLGTIQPQVGAEVEVGSRLSGVVSQLAVGVGDRVERGELLAALDDAEWRARVDLLAAERTAAEAELAYAEGELARGERLSDLVAPADRESLRRDAAVRRAAVARAAAALAEARITLGFTVIRAPVAGTIAAVSTSVGETLAASLAAPTFVTIVDLDRLEIETYVDETDIGRVEVGQAVAVRIDAFPSAEIPGRVRAIYPKAELVANVVNYVVIVDLVDPVDRAGLELRPEMTTHVSFLLSEHADVVSVPRAALLADGGAPRLVVEEAGRFVERVVETGLETPQRIEIVAGLAPGERFVTDRQAWKAVRDRRER